MWGQSEMKENVGKKREVSLMIPSAKTTVKLVAIIVFTWNLFGYAGFWKEGKDWQTDKLCENNYYYQRRLWVGWVDQKGCTSISLLLSQRKWIKRQSKVLVLNKGGGISMEDLAGSISSLHVSNPTFNRKYFLKVIAKSLCLADFWDLKIFLCCNFL